MGSLGPAPLTASWISRLTAVLQAPFPARALIAHEATTLIEIEGERAYDVARDQARRCRAVGSQHGYRFWSKVVVEVARRTGRVIGAKAANRYPVRDKPVLVGVIE